MSSDKNIPRLKNIFLVGFGALIAWSVVICIISMIIWHTYSSPFSKAFYLGWDCFGGVLLTLGAFSPFIARAYGHITPLRIAAVIFSTMSLIYPYLKIPLIVNTKYEIINVAYLLLSFFIGALPLGVCYLISLILAFGEALYIEMQPDMLKKWKWNINNPTTYCLIPYYITLIANICLLFLFGF